MPREKGGLLVRSRPVEDRHNTTVRVDRSVELSYPAWVKNLAHPELESTGMAEYDLAKVSCWVHPIQRDDWFRSRSIYEHLKRNNMLESCLGLHDGLEIQKMDMSLFLKIFGYSLHLYLWRSVAESVDGRFMVPSLVALPSQLQIYWEWLGEDLNSYRPAVRFPA
jgi:hypothetical protein